jgi:hypothetical protein
MNIEAARKQYEEQLLGLPNVTGVGIGERGGKQVIKVFVTRKVPESELQPHEIVPKRLDDWETDVEELGAVTAQ